MSISGRSSDSVSSVSLNESSQLAVAEESFDLIGSSTATQRLRLQIDRIGPHFRSVLVHGEIGTGKEFVARALHAKARGSLGLFTTCYGAALAETVYDERNHAGSPWWPITSLQSGTLFLDGINDLSLGAQERLMKLTDSWTQHRTARRRMIAATSQNLRTMLGAGLFRHDLYQQLATVQIVVEPLRQRREDIPALALYLAGRIAKSYGREAITIAEDAMLRLCQYKWPGNVREMENMLRNAILRCDDSVVETIHLESLFDFARHETIPHAVHEGVKKLDEVVENHVRHVLDFCSGNKVRAAEMLGISRSTLYRMLEGSVATNGEQPVRSVVAR